MPVPHFPVDLQPGLKVTRGRSARSPQIVVLKLDNLRGFIGSQVCLQSHDASQSHLAIVLPSNTTTEVELAF